MQKFLKELFLFLFILFTIEAYSQISAQWRGPARDGKYPCENLLKSWPDQGPEIILELRNIGAGYSQPVVKGDIIYVTGMMNDTDDVLSAFDLNGNKLWQVTYAKAWDRSYPETRSTPTIEGDRIYLAGGLGAISCIDANTGDIIWQRDAHTDYGGEFHRWGVAESVLLCERAAYYTTGGENTTMVALNKNDGSLIWKTKSLGGERAYASPLMIEHGGLQIILAQTADYLTGINAADGEILWSYDMRPLHQGRQGSGAHNNTPLFKNGEIFVTNGYDRLAAMFSLAGDGRSISVKWKNDVLDVHHGGVVVVDGNIYGANWLNNARGNWASIRWDNGQTNWETEWHTKGSVVYADGMLYIHEERSGHVALVKPDPSGMKIISTFLMNEGEGPHWAHPSIYNGMLFIRHGNAVNVYRIAASS